MNSPIFLSSLGPFLNQFLQYKRALNRKYCADAEVLRLFDRYIQSHNIAGCLAINSLVIDDFLRSHPRRVSARSYNPVAEAFLKDEITIGHALLIAKLQPSQQQEAFAAAFWGMWTSEGNSQVPIPARELALCGSPHNANNAESGFMQSAAA